MNNNNKDDKNDKSEIYNIHDVSEEISKELMDSDLSNILMNDEITKELMNIDNKQSCLNKSRNKIISSIDSSDSSDSSSSESTRNSSIDKNKIKSKTTIIKKADNNFFLQELIDNQLKSVNSENKLSYSDMKRICKNLKKSIFDKDSDECALWTGYITNNKNGKQYINFYFKKKKVALHRLLYMNYIGNVSSNEYLKLTCTNSGKCCSIHHIKIANSKQDKNDKTEHNSNTKKNEKSERNNKVITIREKVDIEI